MEMESILECLSNKTILVTGATGFLGKIFVEKILRVQPNIKKIYLLIRASNPNMASHRMHSEIIGKDLFRVIKENHGANMNAFISEKVTAVAGDIGLENFGVLNSDLFKEMREQVDVIVNSAATTNFDERYDMAFATNTLGAKHVSSFVNQCINIKVLLHVSTAFVSGEQSGIILETPFKMSETLNGKNNLDIQKEMKVIQERLRLLADKKSNEEAISADMKEFGMQRAKLHGWPNTYVFTKAMGEMLLFDGLRQDVSLVIVRPTIVTSTYKEPFPGWIEGVKAADGLIATYGRGRVSCFLAELSKVFDVIPADMVINAMIVGMVVHTKKPPSKIIYLVGSSTSNPMKMSSFMNYMFDYFANKPLRNQQGNPIIPATNPMLLESMSSFKRYMAVRYIMPLKGVKYANIILFRAIDAWYLEADRKIKTMLRIADLYKPYTLINVIYDDTNLKTLHGALRECSKAEKEMFYFDVKSVNWEDYFKKIHIPGLVKYELSRVEGKVPKHGYFKSSKL